MAEETRAATGSGSNNPGPFLAKVVSHLDPTYMGGLEVQLLHEVGNDPGKEGQTTVVKYMSPFMGSTSIDFVSDSADDYENTQKSYGMWMVPPDVGSTVIVFFIDGDPRLGYWIGCVQDEDMNFMVPGIAATSYKVSGSAERVPVAEYNKTLVEVAPNDTTKVKKPAHPLADVLKKQGLLQDDIRGITSSSARRETPSAVFGISTPGPIDKRPGAKKGKFGKSEHATKGFVSRLGGTTFVMDDGDDKFLRKKPAGEAPPQYASVEQDETGGDPTILHNELFRIRTRTGHQILLHNSEDLIYIGNAKGTTWIELTSNGKIDIFAEDSISIHTKNDLNVTADRDINLTAARDVNVRAGRNHNMTAVGATHIRSGGNHIETAAQIHMNGPAANTAPRAQRIPQAEPWAGHENLDPQAHTPAKTAAVANPTLTPPAAFKKYTTATDTFSKLKGTED